MSLQEIVYAVFLALIIAILSTILHELAHAGMCRIFKCKIVGLKVLFLDYDGSRLHLDFKKKNHCAFITESRAKMKAIVAAGPLIESILSVICAIGALSTRQSWIKFGLIAGAAFNVISVIYNLLPTTNGDGKMLFGKDGVG